MRRLRVSVLQVGSSLSKDEARSKIERLARASTGDILVVPEYAMIDPTGMSPERLYSVAESLEGEWVGFLSSLAREKGSCIVGTMFERSEDPPLVYNTVIAIDDSGRIRRIYRKTHLFDVLGYRESSLIKPGREPPRPVELCGASVGLAVCFELRYPELFRLQALEGAEVFIVPSAWYRGPGKEEAYRFLAQARAHENVSYLVGAVLYGERFTGRSIIVNPYGVVEADAGWGERVLEHTLEPTLLEEARSTMPLLRLRRTDLYLLEYRG